jgi:hypothetical protein
MLSAWPYVLTMMFAAVAVILGLASNYVAGWFGKPAWLKTKHVIISVLILVLITGSLAALQSWLTANSRGKTSVTPLAQPTLPGNLPSSHSTSSGKQRTPQEWAAEVEVACRKMGPELNADLNQIKTITPGELESSNISPRIPQILGRLYTDYAKDGSPGAEYCSTIVFSNGRG